MLGGTYSQRVRSPWRDPDLFRVKGIAEGGSVFGEHYCAEMVYLSLKFAADSILEGCPL